MNFGQEDLTTSALPGLLKNDPYNCLKAVGMRWFAGAISKLVKAEKRIFKALAMIQILHLAPSDAA